MEGEDELQDEAAGGGPSSGSAGGWNTNPAPIQPTPFQPAPVQPQEPSVNIDPFNLPDPPKDPEPKHPGGFVPYMPELHPDVPVFEPTNETPSALSTENMLKAQKYCKYVQSALTYEDVPTAILNLKKCLQLLETGRDS